MTRCCRDLIRNLRGSQRKFGRSRLAMQMERSRRRAERQAEKAEDQGGSRAEADDPNATPRGKGDAEPSGSGNSSVVHFEE